MREVWYACRALAMFSRLLEIWEILYILLRFFWILRRNNNGTGDARKIHILKLPQNLSNLYKIVHVNLTVKKNSYYKNNLNNFFFLCNNVKYNVVCVILQYAVNSLDSTTVKRFLQVMLIFCSHQSCSFHFVGYISR